ncbi:hypothetical protein BY998_10848 [Methylobacterium sp. B4]|nr:hypothetical protein BY998_10848 [Methylobacterium sp. B4]
MSDVTTDTVHRQVQANMLVKRTDNFGTAGKIILTGPFFGHAVFIVWMIVVSFQTLRIEGLLNAFFCKQIFIANTIFIVTYYIVSLYTAYLFGFIPAIIGVLLYMHYTVVAHPSFYCPSSARYDHWTCFYHCTCDVLPRVCDGHSNMGLSRARRYELRGVCCFRDCAVVRSSLRRLNCGEVCCLRPLGPSADVRKGSGAAVQRLLARGRLLSRWGATIQPESMSSSAIRQTAPHGRDGRTAQGRLLGPRPRSASDERCRKGSAASLPSQPLAIR